MMITIAFSMMPEDGACISATHLFEVTYRIVLPFAAEKPAFCHELDCPLYEVKDVLGDSVELRSYQPGLWVSTQALAYFLFLVPSTPSQLYCFAPFQSRGRSAQT